MNRALNLLGAGVIVVVLFFVGYGFNPELTGKIVFYSVYSLLGNAAIMLFSAVYVDARHPGPKDILLQLLFVVLSVVLNIALPVYVIWYM